MNKNTNTNIQELPSDPTILRVLSLGAGVQSTCLLRMALNRELENPPDYVIYADTGWEPPHVYANLWNLAMDCANAGLPLLIVRHGNLRTDLLDGGFAAIPLHAHNSHGARTMLRRQCTRQYKVAPVRRAIVTLKRRTGATRVEMQLGISWDEAQRMSDPRTKDTMNRYPLVDLRMRRQDCIDWLKTRGYPVPGRSACLGCPYRTNTEWAEIREHYPLLWAETCELDEQLRRRLLTKLGPVWLHRSQHPLSTTILRPEDAGQLPLWGEECEGMCSI